MYGGTVAGGNNTGCQLTSAWGFNASYEHYWTPAWHTSLYGAWYQVSYNNTANAILCSAEGAGNGAGTGATAVATPGCNNKWSDWGVGSRTQWDVTKTFYLGVEVLYSQLRTAQSAHSDPWWGCHGRRRCGIGDGCTEPEQLDGQRSRPPRLPAVIVQVL